jgi:hypothetical protein
VTPLLIVATQGSGADLAIEAGAIAHVIPVREWHGPAPLDVCALFGVTPREGEPRLAILDAERAVVLHGRLALVETADETIHALPAELGGVPRRRAIRGVVLIGARPQLVIALPALFEVEIP